MKPTGVGIAYHYHYHLHRTRVCTSLCRLCNPTSRFVFRSYFEFSNECVSFAHPQAAEIKQKVLALTLSASPQTFHCIQHQIHTSSKYTLSNACAIVGGCVTIILTGVQRTQSHYILQRRQRDSNVNHNSRSNSTLEV